MYFSLLMCYFQEVEWWYGSFVLSVFWQIHNKWFANRCSKCDAYNNFWKNLISFYHTLGCFFDYLGISGTTMFIFVKHITLINRLAENYFLVVLPVVFDWSNTYFSSMILELYILMLFSCFISNWITPLFL